MSSPPNAPPGRVAILWALAQSTLLSRPGRHVLVVLGLISVMSGTFWYAKGLSQAKAVEWLNSYNGDNAAVSNAGAPRPTNANSAGPQTNVTQSTAASGTPATSQSTSAASPSSPSQTPTPCPVCSANCSPPPLATDERQRLSEQLSIVKNRITHHGDVMRFFFAAYYISVTIVLVSALGVAISLFFIAIGGWTSTNEYVRTLFITTSAFAALFGLIPSVFEHPKNIANNKELFLQYKTLESEIQSYPVTRSALKNECKTPKDFINFIDVEMDRIGNIAIGFDITKIDYKTAFQLPRNSSTPAEAAGTANKNANAGVGSPQGPGKRRQ